MNVNLKVSDYYDFLIGKDYLMDVSYTETNDCKHKGVTMFSA
jgi:hypothetical protein